MIPTPPSSANSIDTHARRIDITPGVLNPGTALGAHGSEQLNPNPRATLSRHYTSFQQHADHVLGAHRVVDDDGMTPRQEGRREGFNWSVSTVDEAVAPKYSCNPLPPAQISGKTPPPLEELLRHPSNDDADTAHNASVARVETFDIRPLTTSSSFSSAASSTLSRHNTARSSIASFARGLARHVSDVSIHLPPGVVNEQRGGRRPSVSRVVGLVEPIKGGKFERKLSFVLPPILKQRRSAEKVAKPTFTADLPSVSDSTQRSVQPAMTGSLRERRKVKLDLSLPTEIPDLPARSRPPIGNLSSITPSRPRSPKTPWIRNESPTWQQYAEPRTAPILEEDYIGQAAFGEGGNGFVFLPGTDTISSSQSPKLERPPIKARDRCYIARPRFKRSRSGRSGTSESTQARTPDGNWTPDETRVIQEKQARTIVELQQLGQTEKLTRSSRWRWTRSTTRSSDEGLQPQVVECTSRRFSVNPFKRSGRIPDQTDRDKEKGKHQSPSRPWWIGKQAVTSAPAPAPGTFDNMTAPPVFVPPGLKLVPTPAKPDANGEVKGKLADFSFDLGAGIAGRRPKPSPGGHWDSDALLMSFLSPDLAHNDSTEEEGPEGPVTPNYVARIIAVDKNASSGTPGLVTAPGEYMDANPLYSWQKPGQKTPSPDPPEVWFRVPQGVGDDSQLTPAALREKEERRKFEWIVPEHLPASPLCPLHAKYYGYSRGMCYWHSKKKKKKSIGSGNRPSMERGGAYEPDIQRDQAERVGEEVNPQVEDSRWRVGVMDSPPMQDRRKQKDWSIGDVDSSPKEEKTRKRRLESFSSPGP
ncbi:hypothetical protein CC86DRAFT_354471 [Ophiobolus disseminans]|uniref:Uncharacterized protein n=1 Tax=Ophiobolus disseminans TaxID=1469910 RepID=A0A6A6ZUK1_9PLEO|nr:hypothetical protein CC86DRAFT_354471 [Ophiobolus disseminans]